MDKTLHNKKKDLFKILEVMNKISIKIEMQLCYAKNLLSYKPGYESQLLAIYDLNSLSVCVWKCAVLDLNKLFPEKCSKNDKYCFNKLLNKCSLTKGGEFKKLITNQNLLSDFETEMLKNQETIKKIQKLRDEFYAHTDNNSDINSIEINFNDAEKLSNLAKDILNKLHLEVFEYPIDNSDLYNTENNIVKDLIGYRKMLHNDSLNTLIKEKYNKH